MILQMTVYSNLKKDVCFMCSMLVSPRGFKNDECYMRIALRTMYISCVVHLFGLAAWRTTNDDECYLRMAVRTTYISCVGHLSHLVAFRMTYISCVARLFGLMAERDFLCCLRNDFRLVQFTISRTNCLHRIRVCLPTSLTALAPVNLLLPVSLIKRFVPISVPVVIGLNPLLGED